MSAKQWELMMRELLALAGENPDDPKFDDPPAKPRLDKDDKYTMSATTKQIRKVVR